MVNKLNADSASEIVKRYFKKIHGEKKLYGVDWVDLIDFKVISAKPYSAGGYEIICEMRETPISSRKEIYKVLVEEDGIISSVERKEE